MNGLVIRFGSWEEIRGVENNSKRGFSLKIIAISDVHHQHRNLTLPPGDVLVCAGDMLKRGTYDELVQLMDWMSPLNYTHKIIIPGNHDWVFEKEPDRAKKLCSDAGAILLNDSGCSIDGVKFWGSPVTPWFYDWAFNRARNVPEAAYRGVGLIKDHWDLIPDDTDVLITHGPPYDILDHTLSQQGLGCVDLRHAVLRVNPKVHIFGHIHYCGGQSLTDGATTYYNVAVCDELYSTSNKITGIEYE